MSNLTNELANRGSKLCMQICVNNLADDQNRQGNIVRLSRKNLLDIKIGLGNISWISPLSSESFIEYEMKNLPKKHLIELGLDTINWNDVWPSRRQPQWDAIGIAPDGTLIIVEAKAHINEIMSRTKLSSTSISARYNRILNVLGESLKKDISGQDLWLTKYYQIANRFCFLDGLKNFLGNRRSVLLVFLYFINDCTHIPTTQEQFQYHIQYNLHNEVNIPNTRFELNTDYKIIYYDIWNDRGI
jgi:hypothetical protein